MLHILNQHINNVNYFPGSSQKSFKAFYIQFLNLKINIDFA